MPIMIILIIMINRKLIIMMIIILVVMMTYGEKSDGNDWIIDATRQNTVH